MTYRWPKPEGISSAVTLPELELLQTYAAKAGRVLEIGTHFGFSCIGMALAGAHVTSVDPHYEGPADAPDTWEPFLANLRRHHISYGYVTEKREGIFNAIGADARHGDVLAVRTVIENPGLPFCGKPQFGLVFIDGDHVWPCPWRDTEIALAHLIEPGYIAYHDVTPRWSGVWRATQELEASGRGRKLKQVGTLAVYQNNASSVSGTSITPAVAL